MKKMLFIALTYLSTSIYAESVVPVREESLGIEVVDLFAQAQGSNKEKEKISKKKSQTQSEKEEVWIEELEDDSEDDETDLKDDQEVDKDSDYSGENDPYAYEKEDRYPGKVSSDKLTKPKQDKYTNTIYGMINDNSNDLGYTPIERNPFNGFQLGIGVSFGKTSVQENQGRSWTGGTTTTNMQLTKYQYPLLAQIGYDFQNSFYLIGLEIQGMWFMPTVRMNESGSHNSSTFQAYDSSRITMQYNLNFRLGFLWTPETAFYMIIGPAFSRDKITQTYKKTSMSSSETVSNANTTTGYNIGIGLGTLVSEHIEMHLNGAYMQSPNSSVPDMNASTNDNFSFKPNSVLVILNFVYRI